jgi:hypothetical protein
MRDNKRYCYAYTIATSVSPSGWRGVRPRLALRIIESNTGLFHTFDIAGFYNKSRGWEATIRGRTGTFRIPVSVFKDENDIQSIVPCTNDRSSMCVSNDGMRGLTRGQELTLTGTSSDGRSVSIVYSLNGYQSAIREMNRTCNNDRNTGWLIQTN